MTAFAGPLLWLVLVYCLFWGADAWRASSRGLEGRFATADSLRLMVHNTALVGVAALGYGDGYPRHASSGTPVLVNGQRAMIAGRVSMDMICIDLRACPDARVGDEVILWGDGLPIDEVAAAAGTIAYELLCGVGSRVQFEYSA